MRTIAVLILALPVLAQGPGQPVSPSHKIALFNGRNLDGWYKWLVENKYADPKEVFTVKDKMIRISGEEWGEIATRQSYRDYHLIVEWRWGGATWGTRKDRARDSGILVHGVGEDGGHEGIWLESIESQIIEGGTGDFILVGGKNQPSMTENVREFERQYYWDEKGTPKTLDRNRFNWYGRDPKWQDTRGYRGPHDVERPVGEWNRQEVIAEGDTLTNILNGVVVNRGYRSSHTAGKIQIQSEGAEIYIRRVELQPVKHQARPSSGPASR